jgi:hypothetical protein
MFRLDQVHLLKEVSLMNAHDEFAPDYLYAIHPGRGGDCGLQGLRKEGQQLITGQNIYRCQCGFRWFLYPKEIVSLEQTPRQ